MRSHSLVHSVGTPCAVPAALAFSFLADSSRLGTWALGCWGATPVEDAVVRGRSLLDGSESFVRVVPHEPTLSVDFAVGDDLSRLRRRIAARAVPGEEISLEPDHCLLLLLAWRPATMSDARWHQLVVAHEVEILVLRRCIEAEMGGR